MRGRGILAQVLLLAAVVHCPAAAQNVQPLTLPADVTARLEEGDRRTTDNAVFDDYPIHVSAGQRIQIALRSNDFDAVIQIFAQNAPTTLVASDDDGGGGLNASLTFAPAAPGDYIIRVTSFSANGLGAYELQAALLGDRPAPRALPAPSSTMAWSVVEGQLEASQGPVPAPIFHEYGLRLRRGQTAIIRLDSPDFDSMLSIYGGSGNGEPVATDDDSGGGLNSLVILQAPSGADAPPNSDYVIRVRSLGGADAGSYTLRVGR